MQLVLRHHQHLIHLLLTGSTREAARRRKSSFETVSIHHPCPRLRQFSRGPPGGPPLPPNPGGPPPGNPPPNPGNPPGGGPPTPAAGPPSPTPIPRPAGLLIPGPAAIALGAPAPPGALVPNLAEGSAGGGPSTEQETIWVPRTMVRPRVRFSSDSTRADVLAPGAGWEAFVGLRLTRRNSSVSARTRFICCQESIS